MRRPAERAALAVALIALALAGCAPAPPPPGPAASDLERVVALEPLKAQAELARVASAQGLRLRADGALEGVARADAAVCPKVSTRIMGRDTAQRRDALLREVGVVIAPGFVAVPEGTRVSLAPSYTGRMLDRLNYHDFEVRCRPTGVLERALLDGLAAGG